MTTTEEFAIFLHYQIPVVTRITSLVYKYLKERGTAYLVGTFGDCEDLANVYIEVVALKEEEIA